MKLIIFLITILVVHLNNPNYSGVVINEKKRTD